MYVEGPAVALCTVKEVIYHSAIAAVPGRIRGADRVCRHQFCGTFEDGLLARWLPVLFIYCTLLLLNAGKSIGIRPDRRHTILRRISVMLSYEP